MAFHCLQPCFAEMRFFYFKSHRPLVAVMVSHIDRSIDDRRNPDSSGPDHNDLAQTDGGSVNAVIEVGIGFKHPRGISCRGGGGWAKRCTINFRTHTIPLHSQGARQSKQSRPRLYATASDDNRTSANINFFSFPCFATCERFRLPHDKGQRVNLLS